mmetsp:Transcript_8059/g.20655  ORF Transcript_8059/g.20655 Transcript_8059/m.20655 type:complete len:601 (+) Transcript_8059:47-1849(+)
MAHAMELEDNGEGHSAENLSLMVKNLQNEVDITLRLQAARELPTIAAALGPERVRGELLPYLQSCIDDEDEVADVICDKLAGFIPFLGGSEWAHLLLPILEMVAAGEEVTTRAKAVQGLTAVATELPQDSVLPLYLPIVERLANGDWYTQRASACGLLHIVFKCGDVAAREQVVGWLNDLSADPAAMVRRAVGEALPELVTAADPAMLSEVILPLFNRLNEDEQDSVRLLAARLCIDISQRLDEAATTEAVLPATQKGAADESWRVRYVFAGRFSELQETFGPDLSREFLLPIFVELLGDGEPEVRAAAALQVHTFCAALTPEKERVAGILEGVLPKLHHLVQDEAQHVRCAVASIIMGLASLIGAEHTITYLLPLFLQLIRDDFSEVQLNMISNLEAINQVIGIDQLAQALEPAINELLTNESWRVRLATIELLPLVSKQLGVEYFEAQLLDKCLAALTDSVFCVRSAAVEVVRQLTVEFGAEWSKAQLIPQVMSVASEGGSYNARLVVALSIKRLVDVCSDDIVTDFFLPMVEQMRTDDVANIRFNVAQIIVKLLPHVSPGAFHERIKPAITALLDDGDRDVVFFAKKAEAEAVAAFS